MHQQHITTNTRLDRGRRPDEIRYYGFGPYALDTVKRVLWRGRTRVALTRTPFDLLVTLIHSRDRVLGKDELIDAIWRGQVVEENSLARHISALRKALHDTREDGEYITTVHALGYRFTAPVVECDVLPPGTGLVETIAPADDAVVAAPQPVVAEPSSAPPRRANPPRSRLLAAAAIVVGTLAATTGGLPLIEGRGAATDIAAGTIEPFTYGSLDRQPAWSPDGRSIAYTSDRAGNADIWVRRDDNPSGVRVTTSAAQDWQPDWSPDGGWLAFRSERGRGGIYVISPSGHSERQVAPFGYLPQWSADSRELLFVESNPAVLPTSPLGLYVVDIGGGPVRRVLDELTAPFVDGYATWHPRGRQISVWGRHRNGEWAFLSASPDEELATAWTIPDHVRRQLDDGVLRLGRFVWARSERFLFFEGVSRGVRNIWRVTVDPASMAWIGAPERLTLGAGQDSDIALAPDDSRLAFSVQSQATRVWSFGFDPAQGRLTDDGVLLTPRDVDAQTFDVTTSGRHLIYKTVRGEWEELWAHTIDNGTEERLLASTLWRHAKPRLSRDGARIAYVRTASSDGHMPDGALAVFDTADGTERVITGPDEGRLVPYDWSADGESILSQCRHGASSRSAVCLVDARGGAPAARVLIADPRQDLVPQKFSPDQRWIGFNVFHPARIDVSTLYVARRDGGSWTAVTDGHSRAGKLVWSPDGRVVYYVSNEGGIANVWGRRFDPSTGRAVGEPHQVTRFQSARRMVLSDFSTVEIAIAGNRLVAPITEASSRIWTLDLAK